MRISSESSLILVLTLSMKNNSLNVPLVSLIMLSYNQESYIEEAINSAFSQDYSNLEIVISDDSSIDQSFEIIKGLVRSYKGKHTIRINQNPKNLGLAGNYNKAVSMTEANIIVCAAGDDICFKNKVTLLTNPIFESTSVIATHSSVIRIDTQGKELGIMNQTDDLSDLKGIIKNGYSVISQAHAFRKSVFDHFGPFSEEITNEGKIFSFRELCLGEIVFVEEPTMLYRMGSGVSTYQGKDVDKITLSEPRKIVSWRYTTLKQLLDDVKKISDPNNDIEELIKDEDKIIEIVTFASFSPDMISGDFSAEIRLGYIIENGIKTPFKGGLFTGNIFEISKEINLSNEKIETAGYIGPKQIKFFNANIIGL
jgi:glycosyltransferase involved in cell wall biosynthesis